MILLPFFGPVVLHCKSVHINFQKFRFQLKNRTEITGPTKKFSKGSGMGDEQKSKSAIDGIAFLAIF